MAGFKPGLDKFASELGAAECRNMADQHVDLSDKYDEAACDINNKIAKQAALQNSCFCATVMSPSTLKTGTLRPRATVKRLLPFTQEHGCQRQEVQGQDWQARQNCPDAVENADGCKQMAASSSTARLKITKTHTKAEASAAQK